ncbi:diphthine--ammonia ligase [Candidatus Woesearchaeota archaeon]|nr:diphthine--ammonia ligase [Candidatus Woesearchaeota archaeon]
MKLAALISGGKDSWYAAYQAKKLAHEIVCLITLNPEREDSWMFHVPNIEFVPKQAEAADLPLVMLPTSGIKEEELKDLKQAIKLAKDKYKIQGVCAGALASQYQKQRVENICTELELKTVAPMWHMDPEQYMRALILDKFEAIIVGVAAEGLNESFLGRKIDRNLIEDLKKTNIHIAGEGGEYESFVLDCPLFKKRLEIWDSDIVMESENTGKLIFKEIQLLKKSS